MIICFVLYASLRFVESEGSPVSRYKTYGLFRFHERMPICRFHELSHPYVKHTTKKYNSEKQKTQATKMDLIAWGFCFCIVSYSKRSWTL